MLPLSFQGFLFRAFCKRLSIIVDVEWTFSGRINRIPAVFHSCWQAPDGSVGVTLANWTTAAQTVVIRQAGLQAKPGSLVVHVSGPEMRSNSIEAATGGVTLTLPPISIALLENCGR